MIRIEKNFTHEAKKGEGVSFGLFGQIVLSVTNGENGTPVFKFGSEELSDRLVDALLNGALNYRFGSLAAGKKSTEDAAKAFKEKVASWQDDTVTFRGDGSSGMTELEALTARAFMAITGFKFPKGDPRDTNERNEFLLKAWQTAWDMPEATKEHKLAEYAGKKAEKEMNDAWEQAEADRLFRLSIAGDVKL